MRTHDFRGYAFCVTAALLSACGAVQPPTKSPMPTNAQGAQTAAGGGFNVLYNFTGASDGGTPTLFAALAMDRNGNFYGSAAGGTGSGCSGPCGVVFEMTRGAIVNWRERVLFNFSISDGEPDTSLALDSKGNILGGASGGKQGYGNLVYELTRGGGGWSFGNIEDPGTNVGLVADAKGQNFYGFFGDSIGELSPRPSGWTLTTLHPFCPTGWNCRNGDRPLVPLSWDSRGNLYGTTYSGGLVDFKVCGGYCGVAFRMIPGGHGSWKYRVLHRFDSFTGDGATPYGGLIVNASGNAYGTTTHGGPNQRGTIFKLAPLPNGRWKEALLYDFPADCNCGSPGGNLVFDRAGNLYGTAATFEQCVGGGYSCGLVFKLTPQSNGKWNFNVVHLFRGPDGQFPNGLTIDSNGRLYGTTTIGGAYNAGVVFEITP